MDATSDHISTTRLYGSAVALVSGVYSVYLAIAGPGMGQSAWFMLLLGIIVIVHGVVLVTPVAAILGAASGPLMILYALLMVLNQGWMLWMADGGMNGMGGMDGMGGMSGMTGGQPWNAGMVAIALLMFVSGIIMTVRSGTSHQSMAME